jgi:hypothetical protein
MEESKPIIVPKSKKKAQFCLRLTEKQHQFVKDYAKKCAEAAKRNISMSDVIGMSVDRLMEIYEK